MAQRQFDPDKEYRIFGEGVEWGTWTQPGHKTQAAIDRLQRQGFLILAVSPADETEFCTTSAAYFRGLEICKANGWMWDDSPASDTPPPGSRKPIPQCPPEVWQVTPPDPQRCWDAILAMCGATKA